MVDLTSGNLSPENMITTSQEISQSYRRTILQQDDLMIALRGEIGFVAKVPPALVGANLTRGVALIAPDRSKALPDFLVQAIRSDLVRDEILNQVNGSALKEIPISGLRKVLVPIPPLPEQRAIAAILSTWDEAITLTAKLIDVLKRRKAALMQLLIRGDSDLPEGWQLGQLSDFLKQNKEYITELEDKPYPRISVKWWAKGAVVAGYDNGLNVKMERHQPRQAGADNRLRNMGEARFNRHYPA
ncbi:MAG: restriction endonuclease subunit S [Chloroflexi bacterium]|uniref:restriction endonuclease subunit S n=1 Tax=Candidatus Flexifilum breve TaxID=3140694 RepID=UPI00313658B8|nr:restriction endonuclease subunit S [Chloroflexota bacterium]